MSNVFVYCDKRDLGIKMSESVPPEIVRAFNALTPTLICFTVAGIAYGICHHALNTSLPQLLNVVGGVVNPLLWENQYLPDAGQ